MPTFTAVSLDRLLEPGASQSIDNSVPPSGHPVPKPGPIPQPRAVRNTNLERRNSASIIERKSLRPPISPALYATPESTPLPDPPSASSFPPSPYIVNHKRREPRLLKSFSEDDVAARKKAVDKADVNGTAENKASDFPVTFTIPDPVEDTRCGPIKQFKNGIQDTPAKGEGVNGSQGDVESNTPRELGSSYKRSGNAVESDISSSHKRSGKAVEKDMSKSVERDVESEDFFDPQESMSCNSNTDFEDNGGAGSSIKFSPAATAGEFFDAWEELSDSGPQLPARNVEAELREMRLSLLTEIEKRNQAEEALSSMQAQWQRITQQLSLAGLTVPPCPVGSTEGDQSNSNPTDLSYQVYLARFVSESIGRGIARAEMEMELEAKNFEIARLWDRLHYYEAMNQEMSHRNQEAVEMARRNRQARKRRQRWIWGSVAAAITLGTVALAWSFRPAGRGPSTTLDSVPPGHDDAPK